MDTAPQQPSTPGYALTLDVEYPDRSLNRLTSAFRIFTVIPIGIVFATLGTVSASTSSGDDYAGFAATGGGLLFVPPADDPLQGGSTRAGGLTGTASCCASPTASTPTARC
jgi:hypothetical protein